MDYIVTDSAVSGKFFISRTENIDFRLIGIVKAFKISKINNEE